MTNIRRENPPQPSFGNGGEEARAQHIFRVFVQKFVDGNSGQNQPEHCHTNI